MAQAPVPATRRTQLKWNRGAKERGITKKEQLDWLQSSSAWADLPPAQWNPISVLGAGGSAICGRWSRRGGAPAFPPPYDIVVKQVHRDDARELEMESVNMKRMKHATLRNSVNAAGTPGTEHIVDLYKDMYLDPGGGTNASFDPKPTTILPPDNHVLDVARIFIEYCPGGDLDKKIWGLPQNQHWSEEELWRLLDCLAKGAAVMRYGTEQPHIQNRHWMGPQIAHFDLKPENILIGDHNQTPGHPHHRLHPFKIADFGLSLPVPPFAHLNPGLWLSQSGWRHTPGWPAPEQMERHEERRFHGHKANVWGIGMILHSIMKWQGHNDQLDALFNGTQRRRNGPYEYTFETFKARTPLILGGQVSFEAFGKDLLSAPYSKKLIQLVWRCLAYLPSQRISELTLLRRVQRVIAQIDQININAGNNEPMDLGDDLGVNARIPYLRRYRAPERAFYANNRKRYFAPRPVKRFKIGTPNPGIVAGPAGGVAALVMPFPPLPRRQIPFIRKKFAIAWQEANGGIRRGKRERRAPRRYGFF